MDELWADYNKWIEREKKTGPPIVLKTAVSTKLLLLF
jgi:hypothetical protein